MYILIYVVDGMRMRLDIHTFYIRGSNQVHEYAVNANTRLATNP